MRVAFLLPHLGIAGGISIVVEHASELNRRHGFECSIVLPAEPDTPPHPYQGLADVPVITMAQAEQESWDVAVATWWETCLDVFRLDAARHAYFIQLLEDSMYAPGAPQRLPAAMTMALPFRFITAARWIRDTMDAMQPGNRAFYVRSGIHKDVFRSPERIMPETGGPLKVIVEGSMALPLKGVAESLEAVRAMRYDHELTLVSSWLGEGPPTGVDRLLSGITHPEMAQLLSEQHVILKLSRIEGMYGPPLEAFHMGATVVTTAVTGHDDYIRHRWNGLVVGWDDPIGTTRALDLLARDRLLLHRLRTGALHTARRWPSWEQATQVMALILHAIRREPAPVPRPSALRMVSDMASAIADNELRERDVAIMARHDRAVRRALEIAAPALRRARSVKAKLPRR